MMEQAPQTNEFAILQEAIPEDMEELKAYKNRLMVLYAAHAADDQMVFQPIQERMDEVTSKLEELIETV
jgi:hypothetical protein